MLKTQLIKILIIFSSSAVISFLFSLFLIKLLYKYQLWKKKPREKTIDGKEAKVFYSLHKKKEVTVPRLGGLSIWLPVFFVAFFFTILARFSDNYLLKKLNFLSRDQTWLPLATLVACGFLGLCDDLLQIFAKGKYIGGGMSLKRRLAVILLIALIGAFWFYFKLEKSTILVPFFGEINLGPFYFLFFILVVLSCWAGGVIDGIDGLAGGVFAIIFGSYALLAYSNTQYNLSAFSAAISGAILSFLWFNVQPALFYMGETGTLALTVTLAIVAFLADSVLVLPIIAGLLVLEVASVIVQLLAKKFLKRKIFLCAPFHHHLEAKGIRSETITMRFWLLGLVFGLIGVIIRLIS